jgi:CDP-glycerol glycerophosphotransferase (TagB/SpsB family)
VAHFVQNPRQGLILRPHPGLLSAMNLLGGDGGGARISEFRAMCEDIPNVYLDESYDHVPALLAADAMISDLSSMIGEYLCLNRPLGFLKPSSGIELNCDQSWLSNVTTIETEQQLQTFLAHPSRPAGAHTPKRDLGSAARIVTAMVADYRQETASPDAVAA